MSNASAVGHMRSTGLWHAESPTRSHTPAMASVVHRRNRSQQLTCKSSAESFHLTKEALLRRRKSDIEPSADNALAPGVESAMYSTDSLHLPSIHPPPDPGHAVDPPVDPLNSGLTTSTPSAATISSSSADDFTSGMSQSASHPSIPSVVSGASSLSGDGSYLQSKDKDSDDSTQIPSILRTGETVKAHHTASPRPSEEDESRYYCDDEDEDESEDEGLVIAKKPAPKATQS